MLDWLRRAGTKPAVRTVAPRTIAPRTIEVAGRALPLVIRKLGHARQMTLRLSPDGNEVRVTIPGWGRVGDAEAFARSRAEWIATHLAAVPVRQAIGPGGTLPFRGTNLTVEWRAGAPRKPVVADGEITLGGPVEAVPDRLRRWLEAEARRLFAEDLAHYCAKAGRPLATLALSRAQRRWGSCSSSGIIRLNWRLVMAPDAVRRSVVAHEVAHLSHFDHGPGFHAHLAALFEGDLAAANRWLKAEGRGLYALFG